MPKAQKTLGITCIGPIVPNAKKTKKKTKKDSQLVIRINTKDRYQFIALCDKLDTSAAREIRSFIKDFMRKHKAWTADRTKLRTLTP